MLLFPEVITERIKAELCFALRESAGGEIKQVEMISAFSLRTGTTTILINRNLEAFIQKKKEQLSLEPWMSAELRPPI